MFRTFARVFLPNPLDRKLKKAAKQGCEEVVLCWNRGLGDIPLGLYAIVHRIRTFLPNVKIVFFTRPGLVDGFSLLPGVECVAIKGWERGKKIDHKQVINQLSPNVKRLYIEEPSPTDWCRWQLGTLVPRLKWNSEHDSLWKKFYLPEGFTYIGVQVTVETSHGPWRSWPLEGWKELFDRIAHVGHVRVLLLGQETEPSFSHPMIIDLRGKTTLLELLSIIKNRCSSLVLPDSGILSTVYYLDVSFPLRIVSLWADVQGVLKQSVASPNPQLVHCPLRAERKNLSSVSPSQVFDALFPKRVCTPLRQCTRVEEIPAGEPIRNAACVILAGGQGSRLGLQGPKGLFSLLGKSLFQYHLEKVPPEMPVVVMVSPLNRDETIAYFEQHRNFDRDVSFVCQEVLPLLDEKYREVGAGPDGNGGIYSLLVEWLDRWQAVDTLLIIPVENPLADPADRTFLSFHRFRGADVTLKCVERKRGESMGMIVEEQGRLAIAEYIEGVEESEPSFSYTGQLAVSCRFVRKAAALSLPYRWVRKRTSTGIFAWKREKFLFDAFPAADQIEALCYPRLSCYAPIKGLESIPFVEKVLGERS
ncbi:MAG: UTP--glucose-1-phosphate uridylyltransferase [Verrucomicrobiota bacterium]|nr:UTP--glucose-1-phosphate uridylyltransferase [Verrucomicrobiota bacterium]